MANVELVIKIPEEMCNAFRKGNWSATYEGKKIRDIVMNGTPLPKGHDRLIFEEDMLAAIMFSKLFDNVKVGKVKEVLLKIPTIIKADKEE